MKKTERKIPPIVRLQYAKGDLIIKEGDYGISIYEVISGKVGIFVNSGGTDKIIAIKVPGMIIGEMTFIAGNNSPRYASVRVLEDCCLEAWHPTMLFNAYKKMPTIIRLITDQALRIQVRMNKVVTRLSLVEGETRDNQSQESYDQQVDRRKFYRKKVGMECVLRPVNSPEGFKLLGRIRNISREGFKMVIKESSLLKSSFIPGDEFFISTYLSPDQKVNITAKIVWLKEEQTAGTICIGMAFTRMTREDQRNLGFFLMP